MPIRLSGMQSGLDTDSIVKALVSSYSMKKDNLVKAQTKLSWTQEKWKTMNTGIKNFYSGSLSSARFSSNYKLKSASVGDSTVAKVTAGTNAVNGTQSLKVNKLATTGYLTGAQIKAKGSDGTGSGKVTADSTMSDVFGLGSDEEAKMTVKINGSNKEITVNGDTTVNNFVNQLKSAGLNANFDVENGRFFISAQSSGADNDFSLTASNAEGIKALKGMGIYTVDDTDKKEYSYLAGLTKGTAEYDAEVSKMFSKVTAEGYAKDYANKYNSAKKVLESIEANDTWSGSISDSEASLAAKKTDFEKYDSYKKDDGTYDTDKLKADGKLEDYNKENDAIKKLSSDIDKYKAASDTIAETSDLVNIVDGKAVAVTADDPNFANVQSKVDEENAKRQSEAEKLLDSKIAVSSQALSEGASAGAVRIVGQNSEIELNGAKFTGTTNNFSINGLTIQATAVSDKATTITTETDVDGIYKKIKDFLSDYNKLIKEMDEAYNADAAKGYEPLTSEEKEAMSDDEVEKWEKKIKDSLLRKNGTLGTVSTMMKNDILSSFEIDGKKYSLSSFGIATSGYFGSATNEKGVFHIDGDKDDTATAGNTDKLRAAIANDPDAVIGFFSKLANKLYSDVGSKMATSSTSSAYTVYNDKEMLTQYSSYTGKISKAESQVTTWEDYYYKKFSAMESALAKLNSQTSSLTGMMG